MTRLCSGLMGLVALLVASAAIMLASVSSVSAYEGPFCSEVMLAEHVACESSLRSSIRRAIGHTSDAYTNVGVETSTEALGGACRTIECTANTGYLNNDGTGHGFIWNEGPHGKRAVSGYLYP